MNASVAASPVIHARGEGRLDAVVDLVTEIARPRPFASLLDEIPRRVAVAFASEVCSVYLREGDDLVMRGNVGFAHDALGEVRLAVGEGLVGMAVECLRPVSADVACDHTRYRAFPALGEERYPRFLAAPVPGSQGPSGALVVQRAGAAYEPRDVELLAALAGAIAPVLERARIVTGASTPRPTSSTGARRVTLTGRTLRMGRALGVVAAVRRPDGRGAHSDPRRAHKENARVLEKALLACETTIDMHQRAATRLGIDAGFLAMHRMMLDDGRFRERALDLAKSHGLGHGLAQVAREATRAARLTHADALDDRATEMCELCDALRVLCAPDGAAKVPRDAIWIGDTVTVFELLLAARARPAALVLTQKVTTPRVHALIALMNVPAVSEVAGLYAWASDGDVALVDGDHGLVRVNPTRRERDAARVERDAPDGDISAASGGENAPLLSPSRCR